MGLWRQILLLQQKDRILLWRNKWFFLLECGFALFILPQLTFIAVMKVRIPGLCERRNHFQDQWGISADNGTAQPMRIAPVGTAGGSFICDTISIE